MKKHFKSYQNMIFFLFIFTVVCRGITFLNESIGIDTEIMIALKDNFYDSWYGIGRFGLVLLKRLSDTLTFNPYLTGIGVLFLLPLSCILWTWLFDTICQRENKVGAFFFSMLVICSTIMTEQLYFKLQAMEVCMGLCLIPVSLYLIYQYVTGKTEKYKKILLLLTTVCINIVLFSLYQVFVPLFIAGAIMSIYLSIFWGICAQEESKKVWLMTGIYALDFLVSFILNQFIVALFFNQGDNYLGTQIYWNTDGFALCARNVWEHIKEIGFGTQIYYAKTFVVFALIFIIVTVALIKNDKNKIQGKRGKNILAVLCMLGILAAPFYMTFLCGRAPVIRSQMVYPFVLAFLVYVIFLLTSKKKICQYLFLFLSCFTLLLQVKYTAMLEYSDTVRYQSDVRIANAMIGQIDSLQEEDFSCPVLFWGAHEAELNASCIRGEVIGYSFFEWDAEAEPKGMLNTRRILSFMHTLGRNYSQANEKQVSDSQQYLSDMPDWPAVGSIVKKDNVIIVKLGD